MKVVINKCYGGFSVSEAVCKELGIPWDGYDHFYSESAQKLLGKEQDHQRCHPLLIAAIEKVGLKESAGRHAELQIKDIPGYDPETWEWDEYDGIETVRAPHESY